MTQYRNLLSASQYQPLFKAILDVITPGKQTVLDWGCGNGHFSYFLATHNFQVRAFSMEDPPPILALLAEYDLEFIPGSRRDPVRLPLARASLDAVVSVGVLEHVRELKGSEEASLAEIHRVLKPGGTLVIAHLPNAWSWVEFMAARVPGKHHHRWRFTRKRLAGLLLRSGLESVRMRRYGFLPRALAGRVPDRIGDHPLVVAVYNGLDRLLAWLFPPLCTHILCIARKT